VTRFNRMTGTMMERRRSTYSTDELPRTYPSDELLRMARIRLTQRLNVLRRELRHRTAELAAIEACLDEVLETEHRRMGEQPSRLAATPPLVR
jgi:hypothetical protein